MRIEFLAWFARFVGTKKLDVDIGDGISIKDLILMLKEKFGENFTKNFLKDELTLSNSVLMIINGLHLNRYMDEGADPLAIMLKNSDDVTFLPPLEGG